MIFIGIGSNLPSSFGDRFKNIDLAISFLEAYQVNVIKKSSFYETPSFPDKSKPKFINTVISVNTNLPPVDLMSVLIFIEEKLERNFSIYRLFKSHFSCEVEFYLNPILNWSKELCEEEKKLHEYSNKYFSSLSKFAFKLFTEDNHNHLSNLLKRSSSA